MDEDDLLREVEFVVSEAELHQRRNEPLNTELRCWIQPHTMERLTEMCQERKKTVDVIVNIALKALLYDQGY